MPPVSFPPQLCGLAGGSSGGGRRGPSGGQSALVTGRVGGRAAARGPVSDVLLWRAPERCRAEEVPRPGVTKSAGQCRRCSVTV